jgi:hypothetical protein
MVELIGFLFAAAALFVAVFFVVLALLIALD